MSSNYFSRLCGTIRRGPSRSVYCKKNGTQLIQDNGSISQGYFFGHLRLLRCLSSGTFTDLHAVVRTGTIGVHANLHVTVQQRNLPTAPALSHAISIPSASGHSFQARGYHIGSLISETSSYSELNPYKAPMVACGSKSPLTSCSIGNLTCKPARSGVTSYHSYRRSSFANCRKATMSLNNKEQPNNILHYGYFIYNVAKSKGNGNPLLGVGFEFFHISSHASSSAGIAPEASFDNSMKEELHSSSTDSPDQNVPIDRNLKLNSASCYLPHPDKEETGGEDAHFICTNEQAIGVADGVGGWADLGIDAGLYARELMSNSVSAIQEEPRGSVDPSRVLEKAYSSTKAKGSSTACIIALTDRGLHAINLGDSGFMVVRDGCTVFKSPVQQHDFNFTYQLESGNTGDLPSSGQVFTVPVAPGDVIIAGTDGLFDNLYNNEITAVVVHAVRAGLGPQVTAQKIAALARQRAQDKDRQTPFSTAAQEAGFRYYGGKLDDITVVVSYITCDHNENLLAKSS